MTCNTKVITERPYNFDANKL